MTQIPVGTILEETRAFLTEGLLACGISNPETILGAYRKPEPITKTTEFLKRLIHHSYNHSMHKNVIGKPVETHDKIFDELVCHYDAHNLIYKWGKDGDRHLLEALVDKMIAPRAAISRQPTNLWVQFSRSIIDAAALVDSIDDLQRFSNEIAVNEFSMLGAISLIRSNVRGYGDALAADVLKECGLIDSVKPDTHIKKLAPIIELEYQSDLSLLILLNRACKYARISAYEFDKFVWLVFAENGFYEQEDLRVNFDEEEYRRRVIAAIRKKPA